MLLTISGAKTARRCQGDGRVEGGGALEFGDKVNICIDLIIKFGNGPFGRELGVDRDQSEREDAGVVESSEIGSRDAVERLIMSIRGSVVM